MILRSIPPRTFTWWKLKYFKESSFRVLSSSLTPAQLICHALLVEYKPVLVSRRFHHLPLTSFSITARPRLHDRRRRCCLRRAARPIFVSPAPSTLQSQKCLTSTVVSSTVPLFLPSPLSELSPTYDPLSPRAPVYVVLLPLCG